MAHSIARFLCQTIDLAPPSLTIPIAPAAAPVQSNKVYPPLCLMAFFHLLRVGG